MYGKVEPNFFDRKDEILNAVLCTNKEEQLQVIPSYYALNLIPR